MHVCVMCVCLSVCGSCEPCLYVCVHVRDAFKQLIFPT